MKTIVVLCLFVLASDAYPKRFYPRSYMMGGGFYNPRYVQQDVPYPGQMTTMVVGDTVATNSFSGPALSYGPPDVIEIDEEAEHVTEKQQPVVAPDSLNETDPEISEPVDFEDVTTVAAPTTKAPKKTIKARKPTKPPVAAAAADDDDDDDEAEQGAWPFSGAGKNIPNYNAFFPIFIGGSGRSRTRSANDEAVPGSATAIANAFSTGKNGIATSHATSFGDPYAMMRFNFRKNGKKNVLQDEE